MRNIEYHPLSPFLPFGTKIIFLGSFPPPKERWSMNFYYPNFLNDFWRIMGVIFYNDVNYFITVGKKTFDLPKIHSFLKYEKIGIYDTVTAAIRLKDNASDKFLEIIEATNISKLLQKTPECTQIVCTGQKSCEQLCKQLNIPTPLLGTYIKSMINAKDINIWRMPSSSRAYPLALEKKAVFYKKVFE